MQLALLTATVKLFLKRPAAGGELVPKVLKWATEEVENPDVRDRGFMYWRLLSTDPAAARDIVLVEKPAISTETDRMDRQVLDQLLLHGASLASIFHRQPQTFIRGAKARHLPDSNALDEVARRTASAHLHSKPIQRGAYVPAANEKSNGGEKKAAPPALPSRPSTNSIPQYNGADGAGIMDTNGGTATITASSSKYSNFSTGTDGGGVGGGSLSPPLSPVESNAFSGSGNAKYDAGRAGAGSGTMAVPEDDDGPDPYSMLADLEQDYASGSGGGGAYRTDPPLPKRSGLSGWKDDLLG